MKKVISLVLSVMMMLTMFAGCKASGTAETAAPTSSTAAETSADTTPAVQEFNVAIVQQLDHASLDEIRTAIVAQLQALAEEKGAADGKGFCVELCGVCTDICVVSNALLLKAALPEADFIVNGALCAGVTPQKHEAALETMRSCQIEVR